MAAEKVDVIRAALSAAARGVADARVTAISPETRLDAAYRAVMQAALAEKGTTMLEGFATERIAVDGAGSRLRVGASDA